MSDTQPATTDFATTHFGYQQVPVTAKAGLVGKVFSSVAARYDIMNDFMSLGVHRLWKRDFVANSGIRRGDRVLDLAGGTGDISRLLYPRVGSTGTVVRPRPPMRKAGSTWKTGVSATSR